MGAKFAEACAKAGVKVVIIFPMAGPATEKAFIEAIFKNGLVPWVGGEMTHEKYLHREGGFINTAAPKEIYKSRDIEGAARRFCKEAMAFL